MCIFGICRCFSKKMEPEVKSIGAPVTALVPAEERAKPVPAPVVGGKSHWSGGVVLEVARPWISTAILCMLFFSMHWWLGWCYLFSEYRIQITKCRLFLICFLLMILWACGILIPQSALEDISCPGLEACCKYMLFAFLCT
jgi:hypothetical protein